MKQITEDYVSYEIAQLLKEKGFNVPCHCYYYRANKLDYGPEEEYDNETLKFDERKCYSAPTHQMALKWLRENNLYIEIRRNLNTFYFRWKVEQGAADKAVSEYKYDTYEEAVESAILYVLKNLI